MFFYRNVPAGTYASKCTIARGYNCLQNLTACPNGWTFGTHPKRVWVNVAVSCPLLSHASPYSVHTKQGNITYSILYRKRSSLDIWQICLVFDSFHNFRSNKDQLFDHLNLMWKKIYHYNHHSHIQKYLPNFQTNSHQSTQF